MVITGEFKGQKGKVLEMITKNDKAIVEGINMVSKHTKPNSKYPQGGIIQKEAPVHISNLMLIEPSTGKPTRIGRRIDRKSVV